MSDSEFFDYLVREATVPFEGWDFSYLSRMKRMVDSPLEWSYRSKVWEHIRNAEAMLDMGTGGGEFLARLRPLPADTSATESYKPNILVAKKRLQPLGVSVYEVGDDGAFPFDDERFDLVINRHEYYLESELVRVLKPGGYFLTQQVGAASEGNIRQLLGSDEKKDISWNLSSALDGFASVSLEIVESKEQTYFIRFHDVGAIVYYLTAIPWEVPGFSVDKYFDALKRVHRAIHDRGYVDVNMDAFFLKAQKPMS